MPAVHDSAEGLLSGIDVDAGDGNSVDLVKVLLVSGVYEGAPVPVVCDSIDILLPETGDIVSGESD